MNHFNRMYNALTGKVVDHIPLISNFGDVGVSDNSTGIKADNLDKIFSFGFTTKTKSLGLHSSALAAKQIGGHLTAASENQGAVFTLDIPIGQSK
jgi:sensor histidine kinase regulating citrate/malate metabolism